MLSVDFPKNSDCVPGYFVASLHYEKLEPYASNDTGLISEEIF